nr:hypothetical protein [Sphingomonas sp. Y57]
MGIRIELPDGATPLAAVDAIMAMYGRDNIEIAIEALIERLDAFDGDPDVEENGDELDGSSQAEDEFVILGGDRGAGCPISDPGGDPLDHGEWDGLPDTEDDGWQERRVHRDRIRRTRCHVDRYRDYMGREHREYRLRSYGPPRIAIGSDGTLYDSVWIRP